MKLPRVHVTQLTVGHIEKVFPPFVYNVSCVTVVHDDRVVFDWTLCLLLVHICADVERF